jgi:hypothetical protein
VNDDGSEIGRVLGYTTTVYEFSEGRREMPRAREEEFYMEPWGVDRDVAPMEEQLDGRADARPLDFWLAGERRRALGTVGATAACRTCSVR